MLLIYETGPFPTVCVPFRIVPHPVDFNYLFFGYVKHSSGLRNKYSTGMGWWDKEGVILL